MAARLTKRLANQTRDSIQTSMLIRRLTNHALGLSEYPEAMDLWLEKFGEQLDEEARTALDYILTKLFIRMENTQVTAALGLLKKTIPDLKQTEITYEDEDGDIKVLPFKFVAVERKAIEDDRPGTSGEA